MILVTCANGRLGTAIIKALLKDEDCPPLRIAARDITKIDKSLAARCTLLKVDYDDPPSMKAAFNRVTTLMFISSTAANPERIRQHQAVIEAARAAGVKRIVYTSFTEPTPSSLFTMVQAHVETERMLGDSGISHVILRNNQYAANIDGFVAQAIETGTLAMPAAEAKIAYATHDDLGAAAARVLLGDDRDDIVYELTGPEAADAADIASALSAATGREVSAVDLPLAEFAAQLSGMGIDAETIANLASIYKAAAAGEYSDVSGDLEHLIGRRPIGISEYVAALARGARS